MAQSGDSPKTRRRRVLRLVLACVLVVLAAALWPLKGYSIDETEFGSALALPQLTFYRDDRGDAENFRAMFTIEDFRSDREARQGFEQIKEAAVPGTVHPGGSFNGATVFRAKWSKTGAFAMGFRIHNVTGGVAALDVPEAPGETHEPVVTESLAAILDGIEREIPGVTTFYNPPARQLWIDRVRPFVDKHSPKKLAP